MRSFMRKIRRYGKIHKFSNQGLSLKTWQLFFACDMFLLRASAHPRGAFFVSQDAISYE